MPCLYYGDEIGMRYLPDMPDVEGAIGNPAYHRAAGGRVVPLPRGGAVARAEALAELGITPEDF